MTDQLRTQLTNFVAKERALRDAQGKGGQHVGYSPSISPSVLGVLERMLRDTPEAAPQAQEQPDERKGNIGRRDWARQPVDHPATEYREMLLGACNTIDRLLDQLATTGDPAPASSPATPDALALCEPCCVTRWCMAAGHCLAERMPRGEFALRDQVEQLRGKSQAMIDVLKERHYGRMPDEVQVAFDNLSALLSSISTETR